MMTTAAPPDGSRPRADTSPWPRPATPRPMFGPAPRPMFGPAPRPAPRWARRTAHAIALCAVPSGLWRLAMACGIYVGYSDEVLREQYGVPGRGITYLVTLVVLQEAAALLPLLLVTDRLRRPRLVTATAWTASVLTLLLAASQAVVYFTVESRSYLSPGASTVAALCYAPLFVVPLLLTAVTWSYGKRHRPL